MYEAYFGLTGLPFQLNPDPSFLFNGKGHREAFAALREGLSAGARVMVLTGEVGAGKTTLLQAFLAGVDTASTVTAHISASGLDAEMLADRLSEALGQPRLPEPAAQREALLERLHSAPLSTLLVIDEAQHLAPSAFELLETMARATATSPARLQICLVGQPELRFLIHGAERSSFRELIAVDRHLRPLDQAEIRLYIEHRLHRAGWRGRPEYEDAAFVEVFIFTGGIPRRVNLLCNSLMLSAWLNRQERIDAAAVAVAAAALRGEAPQGTPDLLELGSHVEGPPPLTEALELGAWTSEGNATFDESHPWSCARCHTANSTSLSRCWKCKAPRPDIAGAVDSPSDAAPSPRSEGMTDPPTAPLDPAQADAGHARETDELPVLTMSDGSPQDNGPLSRDPLTPRLAGPVQERDQSERRRKTVLASVASLALALAAIAYVMDAQRSNVNLPKSTSRDVVAKRPDLSTSPSLDAVPASPPASAAMPSSVPSDPSSSPPQPGSPSSARSAASEPASRDTYALPDTMPRRLPETQEALVRPLGAASAPPATATPPCIGPAAAFGLCDTESPSSTRRQ